MRALLLAVALIPALVGAARSDEVESLRAAFDLPAQPLAESLRAVATTTQISVLFDEEAVAGRQAPGLKANLTIEQAMATLLKGTGLTFKFVNERTVILAQDKPTAGVKTVAANTGVRLTQVDRTTGEVSADALPANQQVSNQTESLQELDTSGIPQVLVTGSRSLNADIRRTEDDIQPYVVFTSEEIRNSQASNVQEFLKSRLPMNAVQRSNSQPSFIDGSNRSEINLRGLGSNQTLVLVDGRRLPGTYGNGRAEAGGGTVFNQADLNGIPLSAIERIEILPATASAIYGGGATGGVVNVITRHDRAGFEMDATYANTFDTDAARRQLQANGGFNLEGGRTNVQVALSYSDANPLLQGERDFATRARALQLANNPVQFGSSSPPFGFTSNICSATIFPEFGFGFCNEQPLTLEDGTSLGSARTFVPVGYAGPQSDDGAAFLENAGRFNLDLSDDTLGRKAALLATPSVRSASVSARREFTPRLETFVDLSWSRNDSTTYTIVNGVGTLNGNSTIGLAAGAPNNPFNTDIMVSFPTPGIMLPYALEDETLNGVAGAILRLPHEWHAAADYVWSEVSTLTSTTSIAIDATGVAALNDGTLDVMRDVNAFPLDFAPYRLPSPNSIAGPVTVRLSNISLRLAGPLLNLPAGPLSVSSLVEYREEKALDAYIDYIDFDATTGVVVTPGRSQTVRAAYLETRVPLVSARNPLRFVRVLELQGSVRHDAYRTRSTDEFPLVQSRGDPFAPVLYSVNEVEATKYMVGLRFAPIEDFALRASRSTGFLPPSIAQILGRPPFDNPFAFFIDPKRGDEFFFGTVFTAAGGSPDLLPEESKSLSVGLVLTPRFAPDFRLSVDYTHIQKEGEILAPTDQMIIDLEDVLPGLVTRGPNLPGDPPDWAGPVIGLDTRLLNIAKTDVRSLDVQVDYTLDLPRFGDLHFYTVATRERKFARQPVPGVPPVNSAGYADGPLEWRGNVGITWSKRALSIGWNAQYYDSYRVYSAAFPSSAPEQILSQGSAFIPSQTYHDLYARYEFGREQRLLAGMLSNLQLTVGIENLFDEDPPLIATTAGFGGYSPYGDPRLRRYTISVRTQF